MFTMKRIQLQPRTIIGLGGAAGAFIVTTIVASASAQQSQHIRLEQNAGHQERANESHLLAGAPAAETPIVAIAQDHPSIDLAICLDTSGSMSGLIDAAKMKLWDIVNDLALAKPTPQLRVALLTFGNDGHNPEDGWVKLDEALTDDLDKVSEKLFALTTNGGTEYVGRVLYHAVNHLSWAEDSEALRIIVVAGNESADQDQQTPFAEVCRSAISADIMVNAIYCGDPADQIAPAWREVATLADGHFAAIDHNEGTVVVTTPFDDELASLSASINTTYIPFGVDGETGFANQAAQDSNALRMNSAAAASRAQTKGGALYNCSWDLVDACNVKQVNIEEVPVEQLPENMQSMTLEERKTYVEEMNARRAEIQAQIQAKSVERNAYIQEEIKRHATDSSRSFDDALKRAIREQARSKGLTFVEVATVVEEVTAAAGDEDDANTADDAQNSASESTGGAGG